jgi:ABC-type branched-subunit amino acid transport system ATPase component
VDSVVGALLEVAGLRVTYGGVVAVDDVSFTVTEGHVVGLIGPNAMSRPCRRPVRHRPAT